MKRIIRGTFDEKVQQILDGAPGMDRSVAAEIVSEHERLGVEIVEETRVVLQPENASDDELQQVTEAARAIEEAFGGRVLRNPEGEL